jgi:putative two-component system response regulator
MALARFYDDVEGERKRAAAEAARQRQKLIRTRDAIIFGLAKLADSRDPETGDHLERIAVYSTTLAAALRRNPKYRERITPGFIQLIGISSALHDIGKVGIEDRILRKPGPLTAQERQRMQSHTNIGGACLREIELRLGSSNFLQMAREIAYAHHEHWDGKGYPSGIRDTHIPLAARIVAIADVYDALSSRRVYKDAQPHEECVRIIKEDAGRKFDPELIEVWLTVADRFGEIARQYADENAERGPRPAPGAAEPPEPVAADASLVSSTATDDE